MTSVDIENAARELQIQIWRERHLLWRGHTPTLIEMVDPEIAAKVLGVGLEYREELGRFGNGRERFEVAGMINQDQGLIAISLQFPAQTRRFTAAHEIGHRVLHREITELTMHRDRPINDLAVSSFGRPRHEKDADRFAACLLMPSKPLKKDLESTFLVKTPFVLNDDAAYWLRANDPDSLFEGGPLERAAAFAAARTYGGRFIEPLSLRYGVSIKAMAIRLTELRLIL